MHNPFKFYEYEDSAYIYDTNQQRLFQMGVVESGDVTEENQDRILKSGIEVDKVRAWEISGLDKLQPE
ncbi:hypothetical protein [Maridesulfovibrio zosterae]|uniref:hypothetical protein n=1 Tax=Maridesulfovibrio zosterae TaxID=82171 RepID=UPI0004026FB8|nr:hypothetical protein [Maridesulfovibrio zosterae]